MFGDLGPNTLGVTVTWGYFSGPPPTRQLIEWDQIYNEVDFDWSIDPKGPALGDFDFLSVATHEMGHSAGLSHANDTCVEETMYPYISHSQDKERSLHTGDKAGIKNLYG